MHRGYSSFRWRSNQPLEYWQVTLIGTGGPLTAPPTLLGEMRSYLSLCDSCTPGERFSHTLEREREVGENLTRARTCDHKLFEQDLHILKSFEFAIEVSVSPFIIVVHLITGAFNFAARPRGAGILALAALIVIYFLKGSADLLTLCFYFFKNLENEPLPSRGRHYRRGRRNCQ
jgi:hypothetical protein